VTNKGNLPGATADHMLIFKALEARDPEAARTAMRSHLQGQAPLLARASKQASKKG
jgi:DNA-binding GntR family transcriptional regulator